MRVRRERSRRNGMTETSATIDEYGKENNNSRKQNCATKEVRSKFISIKDRAPAET
jgi:hypothetical protein